MIDFARLPFLTTVEVVPPRGPDAETLLSRLAPLASLPFHAFSVATAPVARAHLDALALSALIIRRLGKPVILHCTPRDHNRLSLQGLLWGARASGIDTVLATSGDRVALRERGLTSVKDLDVFALIRMARDAGLQVGVVLNPPQEGRALRLEVGRLRRKVQAGAQFAVTQPVYEPRQVQQLARALAASGIPVLLGILPLRTARHAEFLDRRVAGISVPEEVRRRMGQASDPAAVGLEIAAQMLRSARNLFSGACLMPPFGRYEVLESLLRDAPTNGF